jgi:hypothetical protein
MSQRSAQRLAAPVRAAPARATHQSLPKPAGSDTSPIRGLWIPSPYYQGGDWSLAIFQLSVTQTGMAIRLPSPGGRFENSPPFQGWECGIGASSPEGTAEALPIDGNRIGRMTFDGFSRPYGTCGMADLNPAVNCRAILKSPSGRERFRLVRFCVAGCEKNRERCQEDAPS